MAGESFGRGRRISIDIWSDVMCPFCYMSDAQLDHALEQFPHRDAVDLRFHSFLLMPQLSKDAVINVVDLLVRERGISRQQAVSTNAQIREHANAVGLEYHFDRAVATNMRTAHELSHFALGQRRQHHMIQRLFKAHFVDGLNVGDHDVLVGLAEEIGLDSAAARKALQSGEFADAVEADIRQARQLGITGVPFFVLDNKYAMSGVQPVEGFLDALNKVWAESAPRPALADR
ncbi:DsbA family oxidoreductase [Diaminobutyricibacter tongyongensis]|nr:DsbA family oxidoreductase [Diaminobutyricibacter tongyongensis]